MRHRSKVMWSGIGIFGVLVILLYIGYQLRGETISVRICKKCAIVEESYVFQFLGINFVYERNMIPTPMSSFLSRCPHSRDHEYLLCALYQTLRHSLRVTRDGLTVSKEHGDYYGDDSRLVRSVAENHRLISALRDIARDRGVPLQAIWGAFTDNIIEMHKHIKRSMSEPSRIEGDIRWQTIRGYFSSGKTARNAVESVLSWSPGNYSGPWDSVIEKEIERLIQRHPLEEALLSGSSALEIEPNKDEPQSGAGAE